MAWAAFVLLAIPDARPLGWACFSRVLKEFRILPQFFCLLGAGSQRKSFDAQWCDRLVRFGKGNGWCLIRFRLDKDHVHLESSPDRKLWWMFHSLPRAHFPGSPVAERLGKANGAGEAANFNVPGPVGVSRIKELRVYGPQPGEK